MFDALASLDVGAGFVLVVVGVVVLLLAGLRIKALMEGLTSGARMFQMGLDDTEHNTDRDPDEARADLTAEPSDRQLWLVAIRRPDGLAKAIARQEEIVGNLESQEQDAHKNLLPLASRIAAERRTHERRLRRMRAILEKADAMRRDRDAVRAGHITPEEAQAARAPAPQRARLPRFTGRNLSGVPVYAGLLTVPGEAEVRRRFRRALAKFIAAGAALFAFLISEGLPLVTLFAFTAFIGFVVHGCFDMRDALGARTVRRRFGDLTSVEEFSQRRGVPELTFLLTARAQGVEPRCIVNGKEYYDLADFGDAAVLLRPAQAPDTDALLRPAGHAETDDDEERLLRPAAGERRE